VVKVVGVLSAALRDGEVDVRQPELARQFRRRLRSLLLGQERGNLRPRRFGDFHQRFDRGDRPGHFESGGGLERSAAGSAENSIQRCARRGDGSLIREEVILGLRQIGLRLDHVYARDRAAEEARLRLLHEIGRKLLALLQIFAVPQRNQDGVVRLGGLRSHLLAQLREIEFRHVQVGRGDVAPQSPLARKREGDPESLVAAVAGSGIENVALSRHVGDESRIGERGGGDHVRARLFNLRARRGQCRVAREGLVDGLLAGKPQRFERLCRCGCSNE